MNINFNTIAKEGNQTGKTIYVTFANHTLGCIMPESKNCQLLSCSVIGGAPWHQNDEGFVSLDFMLAHKGKMRLATATDFEKFRVVFCEYTQDKSQNIYGEL